MYDNIKAFKHDVEKCRSHYTDKSLQPEKLAAAYELYQKARKGTELGFTIIGRLTGLSSEDFPGIDTAMRNNLLTLSEVSASSGSILDTPHWSLLGNDAWILGGLHAKTEFHFASPLAWGNLWDEDKGRMTVTAREVMGILYGGYKISRPVVGKKDGSPIMLEAVALCVNAKKAVNASLLGYRDRVQKYLCQPDPSSKHMPCSKKLRELYKQIPDAAKKY